MILIFISIVAAFCRRHSASQSSALSSSNRVYNKRTVPQFKCYLHVDGVDVGLEVNQKF